MESAEVPYRKTQLIFSNQLGDAGYGVIRAVGERRVSALLCPENRVGPSVGSASIIHRGGSHPPAFHSCRPGPADTGHQADDPCQLVFHIVSIALLGIPLACIDFLDQFGQPRQPLGFLGLPIVPGMNLEVVLRTSNHNRPIHACHIEVFAWDGDPPALIHRNGLGETEENRLQLGNLLVGNQRCPPVFGQIGKLLLGNEPNGTVFPRHAHPTRAQIRLVQSCAKLGRYRQSGFLVDIDLGLPDKTHALMPPVSWWDYAPFIASKQLDSPLIWETCEIFLAHPRAQHKNADSTTEISGNHTVEIRWTKLVVLSMDIWHTVARLLARDSTARAGSMNQHGQSVDQ